MTSAWSQTYSELACFIKDNDDVCLEEGKTSIPKEKSGDFWRLLETVENSFLNEYFCTPYQKALILSQEYSKVENQIIARFGLKHDTRPGSLLGFLRSPSHVLREKNLWKQFVGIVNGSVEVHKFRESFGDLVEEELLCWSREGYRMWAILSVMELLNSREALYVPMIDFMPYHIVVYSPEDVPAPVKLEQLNLQDAASSLVIVPDLIAVTGAQYVAFRYNVTNFGQPRRNASSVSDKKEWLEQTNPVLVQPGITVINVGQSSGELLVFADKSRILRPDIILEFRWGNTWLNEDNIKETVAQFLRLRPRNGMFVISSEEANREKFDKLLACGSYFKSQEHLGDFCTNHQKQQILPILINADFDPAKLKPVAEAIQGCQI
ncbi:MAG: hypothetical protein PHW65_01005 [Dehalococcoidales bacterium]|nr:hypothetical protein [Dehalococcoidales bacterium]